MRKMLVCEAIIGKGTERCHGCGGMYGGKRKGLLNTIALKDNKANSIDLVLLGMDGHLCGPMEDLVKSDISYKIGSFFGMVNELFV